MSPTLEIAALAMAAFTGVWALYARGSKTFTDCTPCKVAGSGVAAGITAWAFSPWWVAALVAAATAVGHAGWTGHVLGRIGNHDGVFPLLDTRADELFVWASGAVTGIQVTLPMAAALAGTGHVLSGAAVLAAGALKAPAYYLGGRMKSAPAAEAMHAVTAWVAMFLAAVMALLSR